MKAIYLGLILSLVIFSCKKEEIDVVENVPTPTPTEVHNDAPCDLEENVFYFTQYFTNNEGFLDTAFSTRYYKSFYIDSLIESNTINENYRIVYTDTSALSNEERPHYFRFSREPVTGKYYTVPLGGLLNDSSVHVVTYIGGVTGWHSQIPDSIYIENNETQIRISFCNLALDYNPESRFYEKGLLVIDK